MAGDVRVRGGTGSRGGGARRRSTAVPVGLVQAELGAVTSCRDDLRTAVERRGGFGEREHHLLGETDVAHRRVPHSYGAT